MSNFEKQRDQLVQEVTHALDSVVRNLDVLNRSLHESVEVGKEFDHVGRLWSNFYNEAKANPGNAEAAGSSEQA